MNEFDLIFSVLYLLSLPLAMLWHSMRPSLDLQPPQPWVKPTIVYKSPSLGILLYQQKAV
jgi:hypothetical protein